MEPLKKIYTIPPKIHDLIQKFLKQQVLLRSLVNGFGTPINIVFPDIVSENINAFKKIYAHYNLKPSIYFAHKANKSTAIIRTARHENICIDVSSYHELCNALNAGFTGKYIEVTGPKSDELLTLSLQHECLISIDSIAELEQIILIHKQLNLSERNPILIRCSGFNTAPIGVETKDSRFGIALRDIDQAMMIVKRNGSAIIFRGFAFHIDTSAEEEKIQAIEQIIEISRKYSEQGVDISVYNIGGGYKFSYTDDVNGQSDFINALKQYMADLSDHLVTWNGHTYGFDIGSNMIKKKFLGIDAHREQSSIEMLDDVLHTTLKLSSGETLLGNYIGDTMATLMIEPGRALLEQAGITIASVVSVKKTARDETLVLLDINNAHLASFDYELPTDPIVITSAVSNEKPKEKTGVFFAGNLCIENDFIQRRKIFLDVIPQAGDLVVFINTAAYHTDFSESEKLQQRLAKKIAVIQDQKDNIFSWFEDEQYNPTYHEI